MITSDYETEIISGHKAVVRHIFNREELKVGSRWKRTDDWRSIFASADTGDWVGCFSTISSFTDDL